MDPIQIILIALPILVVGHFADYLFQADAWGWPNPLWKNGYRAPKWGMWDFLPHDPLHLAQQIRNLAWLAGVFMLAQLTWPWYWTLAATLSCNAVARGAGFSIPLKYIARR